MNTNTPEINYQDLDGKLVELKMKLTEDMYYVKIKSDVVIPKGYILEICFHEYEYNEWYKTTVAIDTDMKNLKDWEEIHTNIEWSGATDKVKTYGKFIKKVSL